VTVETLVDCEGTFATVHEAFPAVDSGERWVLPINCVLVRDGDTALLIDTGLGPKPRAFIPVVVLGDVVVHELQVADPDVVYVSDHDPGQATATRRRFLGELADEEVDVIVSHFHGTGRFERSGKGFRWAVE
jgi:glyoxylase-like metal-dependent hydrolase (beta-lactamase superfamily II)